MSKLFVSLVFVTCVMEGKSFAAIPPDKLITALIEQESHGDDCAVGDKNLKDHAYGCLQIRQCVVADYDRWNNTDYQAKDMLGNRMLSIKVCKDYIDHYASEKRIGRTPTEEDMARIWNGGPSGWKKKQTLSYWKSVEHILERSSHVSDPAKHPQT